MPWYRCLLILRLYYLLLCCECICHSLFWRSDQQTLAKSSQIRQNCSPFGIWEGPCTLVCSSTSFKSPKVYIIFCIWQVLIKLYLKQDIVATSFLYNCLLNSSFLSSFGPEEFLQGEIFHKLPEAPSILEGARVCQVLEVSMQASIVHEITSKYAVAGIVWLLLNMYNYWISWWQMLHEPVDDSTWYMVLMMGNVIFVSWLKTFSFCFVPGILCACISWTFFNTRTFGKKLSMASVQSSLMIKWSCIGSTTHGSVWKYSKQVGN